MERIVLLFAAGLLASAAHAGKMTVPADASPAYAKECGECHVAFPPALLAASDWQTVMANLDKHYGDNAAIADEIQREITDFLVRSAGSDRRTAGATPMRETLPRLTATSWFRHEHRRVPNSIWSGKQVRRAANCSACHTRAEQGSFREREIRMPGDARREHN
ncbi:MAG: diheme cytochrome c [Zoogloeaceae bacterium]|jgi:cytochrome c553|nr:diheme cytochrome c [Zoogloeaceae bacterium]